MELRQQLKETEAVLGASKQDLTTTKSLLASVEDQLKVEQEQSNSAAAAAMSEHAELVALQTRLATVEGQLKEGETAAVVALGEKEQLLLRQGQLVQEVDDLRLRCELAEQLLVQLQSARSTHKNLSGQSQGTPDHGNTHTIGGQESSLSVLNNMGGSTSMNGNKPTMTATSESKSEPNLTQMVVNDNNDESMAQPGSGSISLSVTPAASPLRQSSMHSLSSLHMEGGNSGLNTDHAKETKDPGYSPTRSPHSPTRSPHIVSFSQTNHSITTEAPHHHQLEPALEKSFEGDETEGELSVGRGDKDHLTKQRRHQLVLSQAALSIRVTELEGQVGRV